MHPPVLHVAKGLMNADHLVIRMFVDISQYEARIFVAAGWIESSLRCLCCRLVEVLGPSEPSWYEGIDAQVRHLAVWKAVGGHQQLEAIPEVGTPRIFLRNDTKRALPCFLCDSNAVAVDVMIAAPRTAQCSWRSAWDSELCACHSAERCAGRLAEAMCRSRAGRPAGAMCRSHAGRPAVPTTICCPKPNSSAPNHLMSSCMPSQSTVR